MLIHHDQEQTSSTGHRNISSRIHRSIPATIVVECGGDVTRRAAMHGIRRAR